MGRAPKTKSGSNIVSFEDARRTSQRRGVSSCAPKASDKPRNGRDSAMHVEGDSNPTRKLDAPSSKRRSSSDRPSANRKSRISQLAEKSKESIQRRKQAKVKAKAERAYNKSYGAQDAMSAQSSVDGQAGPRAALYKGKAGTSQKRAGRMLLKDGMSFFSGRISIPSITLPKISRGMKAALVTLGCVAFLFVALYGPAQQYYQQVRETDRLNAEYAAVSARNNALQSTIDTLSTEEGIEDKAHKDLGFVKKNEKTASVTGITLEEDSDFSASIVPGSIPAPDTWYSGFLDIFFMYGD